MNKTYVLVNGALIPEDEASIKISDLSVQRGYGIFDFFKTVGGQPVFLDDHLDRFYHSAELMRLPVRQSRDEIKEMLNTLILKNNLTDSGIKMILTGGYSPDGFNIAEPNLIVTQQGFKINNSLALKGISLITHPYQRQFSDAKTLDYLKAIWLQPLLREQGADDVLYHDNGYLRECPRANIFIVTADDHILTPGADILKGITRKNLLKITAGRFSAAETEVSLENLKNAREVFITSTTKNILPVVQIDGNVVGEGRPGKLTQLLANEYNRMVYGAGNIFPEFSGTEERRR